MIRKILSCAVLLACSAAANAVPVLEEGFEDVGTLGAAGWLAGNFSAPLGETDWFQGNTGIFDAQAGAPDSYIAANYLNADFGGNVDNWLVTPLIATNSGALLSFSTRTAGTLPGDSLEILYNNTGTLDLADFVSLGVITGAGFPTDWQAFNFTYGGADTDIRFAFRYTVTDTSLNGDYIGIDSVSVNVPEPATMVLLGAGLLLMPLARRRRRREQA
jgi:hypothetical protein